MTHEEYLAFVQMYNGLKAITKGFKKLSRKNQFVVDFATLMATRETIKDHDSDSENPESFIVSLMTNIAQAQYNMAEIIMKRKESKE